jgi:selenide, water dikinase
MEVVNETIRLTQYSKGAGCGCKIAPQVLEEILKGQQSTASTSLLVGNDTGDDAAVYDMGNGTAMISTTDFFTPIVDDAFDYGRIASANAISDVYAMGGKPIMALAILGWPVDKVPTALAQRVIEGARSVCQQAGIQLAGGHSIDTSEPVFGLAVTGVVPVTHIKRNSSAKAGDLLFLTKPLGSGVISTAAKRGVVSEQHLQEAVRHMATLNSIGEQLGALPGVHAMTDVTGFGLIGHLMEMCKGSQLSAELYSGALSYYDGVFEYTSQGITADATFRNWNAYSKDIAFDEGVDVAKMFGILPDPQTNGGLLVAVDPAQVQEVAAILHSAGLGAFAAPVGKMVDETGKMVTIKA